MPVPTMDNLDFDVLRSVAEHVFMPPKLPQVGSYEETERKTNVALCNSLLKAAQDFLHIIPPTESPSWIHMIKMIGLVRRDAETPLTEKRIQRTLLDMALGDVFCIYIWAQNAALIVRRLTTGDFVQFEVFEVLPLIDTVMKTKGKLLCSYPGPTIQIPIDIFMDNSFLWELSSFLVQMDCLLSPLSADVSEVNKHDSAHPGYISELLVGILRGYGQPAVVHRITKRIGDEVLGKSLPWRRSPLWLVLRVSLHTSLCASNLYKPFILFFHVHLLHTCVRREFPSELLYVMRAKIARRLAKLGPSCNDYVQEFVHDVSKDTEAILSKRWTAFQDNELISPGLRLKGLDFSADSQISLDNSYKYLSKVLQVHWATPSAQYRPAYSHGSRLYNVHDFTQFANGRLLTLATVKDGHIALIDFELSVERNLQSWIASSRNNDHSLDVIGSCIEQYFTGAKDRYRMNPEDISVMILTIMDLWVALDRFAIQECPLLKEYSPEIPSNFLYCLLLHRSPDLKRALRIEEYLCWRHKEALDAPSIFSNCVSDSSFAVKYFRTSEKLQRLYDKINTDAQQERAARQEKLASLTQKSKSLMFQASTMDHVKMKDDLGRVVHSTTCPKCQLEQKARDMKIRIHEWPLPPSNMHAQLAVFELSPPAHFLSGVI